MATIDPAVSIDVDTSRANAGAWLVKMPKYISKILSEHAGSVPNNEIGRLVRRPSTAPKGPSGSSAGGKTQEVSFCLSDSIMERIRKQNTNPDFQMPPQEHRFVVSDVADGVVRTVYTRTFSNSAGPAGERIAVAGKVIKRAEVRPIGDDQYMSMKRKHFELSHEPTSKTLMIQKRTNLYAPIRFHSDTGRNHRSKAQQKRVRGPEDVVLNSIFDAFAKHQFIPMDELEIITQQPKNYLQQLLKLYCNYISARHVYELKEQYRYYGETSETSATRSTTNDGTVEQMSDDDDDDDDDEK